MNFFKMDLNSDFGDENLLDDCSFGEDDDAMSPLASMLIPAVEMRDDEPMKEENIQESDELLDILNRTLENSHKCNLCEKSFKRKSHLQRHYRLHTGEQPYACSYCSMRFARSERRNQHMMRAHPQSSSTANQQPDIKGLVNENDRAKQINSLLSNSLYRCGICNVKFEKSDELRDHMAVHSLPERSKKVFTCQQCPMEFARYDHMIRHQTVHSGTKSFQCRYCSKFFTRSDNRTKHEKTCKSSNFTQNGSNHMPNDDTLNTQNSMDEVDPLEIINVSSILEQEFDDFEGNTQDDLFDGIGLFDDDSLPNDTTGESSSRTSEATRKTQNEADEDLYRLGGIRQRIERPRLTQQEIDTLTCNICNKTLTQKYHLVRHKLIHMGDQKPYKCTICDRTFARRENLKHHLLVHKKHTTRLVGLGINNSVDEFPTSTQAPSTSMQNNCAPKVVKRRFEPRTFDTIRDQLLLKFKLYAIKYRQETSNAIYFHDFYEKCFNFMGNLFMKNIESLSMDTFSDPTSQPQPTQTLSLEMPPIADDEQTAEASVEGSEYNARKMECNICQAVFPSVSHLKRHIVQHTGEKPHHCELCGRDFTRAEHKKRHMMAIHMNQQMYECEICCKRFSRSDHMVAHFRIYHVGIKPYTCKFLCGERFDTFKDKLTHSRTCNYVPPNPDSPDKEDDISTSDNESQEPDQLMQENFNSTKSSVAQFQNHLIKTEKDDTYDDVLGY